MIDSEMENPSISASRMLPTAKPITSRLDLRYASSRSLHPADHVGFGLVHQLVGETLQAIGQRPGFALLNLAAFLDLARTNQLDHARHHLMNFS